jgi:hypothetical protein
MLCVCSARIRLAIHVNNKLMSTNFLLKPNFLLAHRNRYLEGMDNGQKTPCGHPNFDSYVQNLHFFVFQTDGPTDKPTDRQMETLIWGGGWVTTFLQVNPRAVHEKLGRIHG